MGADAFVAFYGVKIALDPDNEDELDACGAGTDPRCLAAQGAGLEYFSGHMTEGEDCFLLLGRQLAWLGVEHEGHVAHSLAQLASMASEVSGSLKAAGFEQAPALHLQFMGQY